MTFFVIMYLIFILYSFHQQNSDLVFPIQDVYMCMYMVRLLRVGRRGVFGSFPSFFFFPLQFLQIAWTCF